jgi:multimeric flavodoxin WrbA
VILGLSAGAPGGSAELLLREALRAAADREVATAIVRLTDLVVPIDPRPGDRDDAAWLWDRLLEADGLIVATPIYSRTVPARLKVIVDRILGPNADVAFVEGLVEAASRGEPAPVPFTYDERVVRPRVAGFIAVGGAHGAQWHTLALPIMHLLTFSMQTAVVDQFLVSGAGTPKSVVLDPASVHRAQRLGASVVEQLGRPFERVEYRGDPGLCPMCHLDVVELSSRSVRCATCGAQGRLNDDFDVEWTDLTTSVIAMSERRDHYQEVVATAREHGLRRDEIERRAAMVSSTVRTLQPD